MPFYYCVVVSQKQFDEQLKHLKVDYFDYMDDSKATQGVLHVFENANGNWSCVVAINENVLKDDVKAIGILVHEGVHMWQKYKEFIGEKNPSLEFEAYGIQKIFSNLMQSFAHQKERHMRKLK